MKTVLPETIKSFARMDLVSSTPLYRLERLEASLGRLGAGVQIYVKRDDHMLIGGGGNKLRKLEFLLGAAIAEGSDTVITVGGLQSNHARLTAAAASRYGLGCELILGKAVPRSDLDYEQNGNVLLDHIFGAKIEILQKGQSTLERASARANELRTIGRKVSVIPTGGSTPLGALGYCRCAQEIQQMSAQLGISFSQVFVPNGSSGTHAGLAAGFSSMGVPSEVVRSYAVLGDAEETKKTTLSLTNDTLRLLGCSTVSEQGIDVDGNHRGEGYGIPTASMLDAVLLLARTEGLLLDPVYSGKAFAGMLSDIQSGQYPAGSQVLFVMTGGAPGLYAYKQAF